MYTKDEFMQHMDDLYSVYRYACEKHPTFPTDICKGCGVETIEELQTVLSVLQKLNDASEKRGEQHFTSILMEEFYEACLASAKSEAIMELYHALAVILRAIETLEADENWAPLSFREASSRLDDLSKSYTTP